MKYEKARAEVIDFGKTVSFMAFSGGPAGQAFAEAAALNDPIVTSEIHNTNWDATIENSVYDPASGTWTITVCIHNPSGKIMKTVTVYE